MLLPVAGLRFDLVKSQFPGCAIGIKVQLLYYLKSASGTEKS
jgi:hypothetical protein